MQNARITQGEAQGGWIVNVDPETGSRVSTRWKMPDTSVPDMIEGLQSAFSDITPAAPRVPPANVMADLCTLYPLMDVHFGMLAWGRETGAENYDMSTAAGDMSYAFDKLDALTPASQKAVLLIGGDFFHADDNRAETPQSKHKLDVDGRQWKVLNDGVALIAKVVDRLSEKHSEVLVRVIRGNHDEHAHLILTFALAERYRECPRVSVEKEPRDLFMMQWGKCLIAGHHGDKAKPDRLAMYLSDVCEFWSATRHRHIFTGHIHHDSTKDLGPVRWESLRAFCPPDSYAASMGYGGRRAIQSITFHKQDGIVLRAIDPIERPHTA
ncbi:hypothetical protein C8254_14155 [Sulfitobacter sp. CB-A]|nr:hypothetical protein C8254_14155 [Sulfitobacter sp. CB-A]